MPTRTASLSCLVVLGVVTGCHVTIEREQNTLPLSFKVEISEEVGTEQDPLPYVTEPRTFTIDVQAVDLKGQPADWFEGEVFLDLAPRGRLATGQARTLTLKKGKAENVVVGIQGVHGASNIWVEDRGSDAEPGSYATGLSPTLHVTHPTLYDVSQTTNIATSALNGDFVQINTAGRRLIVSGIAVDGFYITDLDEPTQAFNAIFARTFSRPRGVETGDLITEIVGTVEEFFGFTQLSFPTYKVGDNINEIAALQLTPAMVADDLEMEKLESRLLEVRDVTVCPLGDTYAQFGQWVVLLDPAGDCVNGTGGITVVSALSATMFTPETLVGQVLPRITGNLRYHVAATPSWILYTRSDDDIQTE